MRDLLSADFVGYCLRCDAGLGDYQAVKQIWTGTVHLVPATVFSGTGGDMYRARELFYYSSIEETQWGKA
jgi:hypothetical protein